MIGGHAENVAMLYSKERAQQKVKLLEELLESVKKLNNNTYLAIESLFIGINKSKLSLHT